METIYLSTRLDVRPPPYRHFRLIKAAELSTMELSSVPNHQLEFMSDQDDIGTGFGE